MWVYYSLVKCLIQFLLCFFFQNHLQPTTDHQWSTNHSLRNNALDVHWLTSDFCTLRLWGSVLFLARHQGFNVSGYPHLVWPMGWQVIVLCHKQRGENLEYSANQSFPPTKINKMWPNKTAPDTTIHAYKHINRYSVQEIKKDVWIASA
jgi:hypothetical protein